MWFSFPTVSCAFLPMSDSQLTLQEIYQRLELPPPQFAKNTEAKIKLFEALLPPIRAAPLKHYQLVKEIAANYALLCHFPSHVRFALSMEYPTDAELAGALLYKCTSYYRLKDRDDGPPYYLFVNHGDNPYYFKGPTSSFPHYYKKNPALREYCATNNIPPPS
jgi:hypothetical protein